MSVENKQVRGDASVSRNVNAGGNARVQGSMHVGHNLRVDGTVEAQNIKAANKGLFLDEAQLKARYPQPEEGWFAGVGSSSPFVVYIARKDAVGRVDWYATNGTFNVDVDMDSYNQRIDELESQLESNNALIAELIEIIREGGGSADLVMITIENDNPTWGSVSGGGLKRKGEVTVTAIAENGYHFVEWQDAEGVQVSTDATYTFEATESVTLKAVFAVSYYTVAAAPNDSTLGSVSVIPAVPAGQSGYTYGTPLTLTATPNGAHTPPVYFVRWSDEASGRESGNERVFDIHNDIHTTAMFEEMAQLIADVEIGSVGRGSVGISVTRNDTPVAPISGNYYVMPGDVIAITATEDGHDFEQWVDGNGNPITGKGASFTIEYDGTQSLVFYAEFDPQAQVVMRRVNVTIKETGWGSVTIDGEDRPYADVADGNTVVLAASPETGFSFVQWKLGAETFTDNPYTTPQITGSDKTYTAEFEHAEEPDFYHGTNTASASQTLYNNANLETFVDGEWMDGANTKTTSAIPVEAGKKYIFLYNALHIKPTNVKYGEDLSDSDKYENFVESEITDDYFEIHDNVVINGVTYTSVEAIAPNSEGTSYLQVTFEKISTSNS